MFRLIRNGILSKSQKYRSREKYRWSLNSIGNAMKQRNIASINLQSIQAVDAYINHEYKKAPPQFKQV